MFDKKAWDREYQRERRKNLLGFREKQNAQTKEWRKKRSDYLREYDRLRHEQKKRIVLEHYSQALPKCVHCGIDDVDVLCIDHINNDGQTHRAITGSGTPFYTWLIKNNFPGGFQILCWNCNHKKEIKWRRNGNSN